mmetsp:Transcript_2641/g.3067  ORF Transcript_2641/g.3067 Transcript_2641/m.3067 type:complete len:120 (-) Transcript_2641:10-369(-)
MLTENTHLKNVTPAGDSNPSFEVSIVKGNTYLRLFLIVAASLLALLALLVLIAVTGTRGNQHFKSSAKEIAAGVGSLVDYQVDTTNLALAKDTFGLGDVSENDEGGYGVGCLTRSDYLV